MTVVQLYLWMIWIECEFGVGGGDELYWIGGAQEGPRQVRHLCQRQVWSLSGKDNPDIRVGKILNIRPNIKFSIRPLRIYCKRFLIGGSWFFFLFIVLTLFYFFFSCNFLYNKVFKQPRRFYNSLLSVRP